MEPAEASLPSIPPWQSDELWRRAETYSAGKSKTLSWEEVTQMSAEAIASNNPCSLHSRLRDA